MVPEIVRSARGAQGRMRDRRAAGRGEEARDPRWFLRGPGLNVESDATKVRQILVNLLSNAVKFTETGSVTAEGAVRGKDFVLRVIDTGIGIQPEHLHRIFDPFWQVEQKATRRATGTGLGLTVTKRLANLLGGDVDVTSTPGEGTTFTVTLPTKAHHIASIPERTTRLRAG